MSYNLIFLIESRSNDFDRLLHIGLTYYFYDMPATLHSVSLSLRAKSVAIHFL